MSRRAVAVEADEVAPVDGLRSGSLALVIDERDAVGEAHAVGTLVGDDGPGDEEEPELQARGRVEEEEGKRERDVSAARW